MSGSGVNTRSNFFAIDARKSICFIFWSITKLKFTGSPSVNAIGSPIALG
jgi:hypothetical protein